MLKSNNLCVDPESKPSERSATYSSLVSSIDVSDFSEFQTWMNGGDSDKGWNQEALGIVLLYTKMFPEYDSYRAYDPSSFNLNRLRPVKSLDAFFEGSIRNGGSVVDALMIDESKKIMVAFTSKNKN